MAKLRAALARIRLPIFSVKHPEAFQIMSCLPIPQPSTLIGALAYCIGVSQDIGTKALDNIKESLERLHEAGGVAARAKLTGTALFSPIILRRFRIADEIRKRMQLYDLLSRGDYIGGKHFLETVLMDAFYREYTMSHEIICVWILSEELMINEHILRLLQRLGDTESLVAVLDAWIEDIEIFDEQRVKTPFPFPLGGARILRGDFSIVKMCDEGRLPEQFIIPVRREIRRTATGKIMILEPTEVEAEFPRPVRCCETSEGIVVMPGGDRSGR